jgi:hypothetical protein
MVPKHVGKEKQQVKGLEADNQSLLERLENNRAALLDMMFVQLFSFLRNCVYFFSPGCCGTRNSIERFSVNIGAGSEHNTNDPHTKFKSASADLEKESDQQDVELELLQEDENSCLEDTRGDARGGSCGEGQDALFADLKEVRIFVFVLFLFLLVQSNTDLQKSPSKITKMYEARSQVMHLVLDEAYRMRREKRIIEAKESALKSVLNDLSRTQSLLFEREADL